MANLSQEKGRAHLREGVAETKDDTAGNVHIVAVGETTKEATKNHEAATKDDGEFTSHVVGNPGAGSQVSFVVKLGIPGEALT